MMSPGNSVVPLSPYMKISDGGEFDLNQPMGQNSIGVSSPFEDIKPRMPPSKCGGRARGTYRCVKDGW